MDANAIIELFGAVGNVESAIAGALAIYGILWGKNRWDIKNCRERRQGGRDFEKWRDKFEADNHKDHEELGERLNKVGERIGTLSDEMAELKTEFAALRGELRGAKVINGKEK